MRRGFWFVAGAGAGVYVMVKARRAAEAFTPDGIRDRMAGLNVGAQLFVEELRTGMAEREAELRDTMGLALEPDRTPALPPAPPDRIPPPPQIPPVPPAWEGPR